MAHEHVYGFCDAKCKVEVDTKANTDAVAARVGTLETEVSGFESRIEGVEDVANLIEVDENQNVTFPAKVSATGGITTSVLNLPVARSGNFAIGTFSSNTLSITTGTFTINTGASTTLNMNTGLTISSTIPQVFNVSKPTTVNCTLTFGHPLYDYKCEVYQNNKLIGSAAANSGSTVQCTNMNVVNPITIKFTNTNTDYAKTWTSTTASIKMNNITYYLV